MRKLLVVLAALACGLLIGPEILACHKCENECCVDATEGEFGRAFCTNFDECWSGFCWCHSCDTSGNSCEGSGEGECDNPFGCEEHRAFRVVPNGESVDPALLTNPPVLAPMDRATPVAAGSCRGI